MRILHLIHDFNIEGTGGGVGRFGIGLAKKLAENGHEVFLAALWQTHTGREAARFAELRDAMVTAVAFGEFDSTRPTGSFLEATKRLANFVREHQVNILHSHAEFGDVALLLTMLTRSYKPQLYRTVHYGYRYEWRKRPERRYLFSHFLLPILMRKEIGVSPAITETLNRRPLARLLRKQSLFIPNALDLDRFHNLPSNARQANRTLLGLPEDAFVFGSVGRLNVQKGYPFFVQAASIVAQQLPGAIFLLAGEGEEKENLLQEIEYAGLKDRFRMLGPISQIEKLFPSFDMFVSSSLWEGLPTVILEAFAARIPVVATRVPGTTSLVQQGKSGWLCDPGSAESLAAAMIEAAKSQQDYPQIINTGQEIVREYSIDLVADQYLKLYRTHNS